MAVAAHGKNLEKIDLGWCKDLTDRGIWAVIENCPALKYLGLIRYVAVYKLTFGTVHSFVISTKFVRKGQNKLKVASHENNPAIW